MLRRLFVYGSLLSGASRHALLHAHGRARLLGAGTIPGALYDLGDYPGAVPSPEGRVVGELYLLKNVERSLPALDAYEEYDPADPPRSEFVRRVVEVTLDSGERREAWAYHYQRDLAGRARIPGGDDRAFRASRPRA